MKIPTIAIAVVVLIAVSSCDTSSEMTLKQRYPGNWSEDFNIGISKALAENNTAGCGQYKYKESTQNSGEYLVRCTRDGENWVSYIVWDQIKKVMGPYTPDPTVN